MASRRERDRRDRRTPPRIEGMVSLKVDNLAYRTSVEDIRRVFSRYGKVGDIYIPRDPYTFDSRGFAFVRYFDERDADDAIDRLDGTVIDGREIRVQMAKYTRPNDAHKKYQRNSRRGRSRSRSPRRRDRSRSRSRSRSKSKSRSYSRSESRSKSRSKSKSKSVSRSKSRS